MHLARTYTGLALLLQCSYRASQSSCTIYQNDVAAAQISCSSVSVTRRTCRFLSEPSSSFIGSIPSNS
eukprot:COSAG02_NODE_320_length_24784_cov_30.538708_15_plen_68_part_00